MFQIEGTILLSLLSAAIGAAGFWFARKKDSVEQGQMSGSLMTELGYLKSSMDTANKKLDKQDERNIRIEERLSRHEESTKQSHRRLDALERRVECLEKDE